ncbi:MAG TPA: zinc ribbon domain-containing protein [Terriglobales bacterium]
MFCQNCGAQVQPGQSYCGSCAKPLTGYVTAQRSKLERHVHLLGIFWVAYSAFSLLGGAAVMIVANTIFGRLSRFDTGAPEFLHPLLTSVASFLLIRAIMGIIAGFGLLQHHEWARILAIILAFLDLLQVPFGTALGIYTIWALLAKGADEEYRSLPQPA